VADLLRRRPYECRNLSIGFLAEQYEIRPWGDGVLYDVSEARLDEISIVGHGAFTGTFMI
jgi:hypothetical protein